MSYTATPDDDSIDVEIEAAGGQGAVVTEVWLTQDQFDSLPEFEGF